MKCFTFFREIPKSAIKAMEKIFEVLHVLEDWVWANMTARVTGRIHTHSSAVFTELERELKKSG